MGPELAPRVSVVVPTYNRGLPLRATVEALLQSQLDRVGTAELIVVDDGSPVPVSLDGVIAPAGFTLQVIRQANRGPAAARNTGFRAGRGAIVLFVDDDIVVPPRLIEEHVAAHDRLGVAVVCGRCILRPSAPTGGLYAFLEGTGNDPGRDAEEDFARVHVVASGQISVPRSAFSRHDGVYRDDLQTPGAEEFELAQRLRSRGLPVFLATRITALHCQPVDIDTISRQQYKHGMGFAEAAVKCPETLGLPEVARVLHANGPFNADDGLPAVAKRMLRYVASSGPVRGVLLALARVADRVPVPKVARERLYRAALGSHFVAGVRRGLHVFGARPS